MSSNNTYDLNIQKPSYISGTNWNLRQLTPVTVIFGKNSSGKSVLLRTIRDTDANINHYCVPERGGGISYNANLIEQERSGQTRVSGSQQNLGEDYRVRVITRIGTYLSKRGSSRVPILEDNITQIENLMKEILLDFEFTIMPENNPPFLLTRIDNEETVTDIAKMSSGETQLLTLSLDLILACELWKLDGNEGTLLIDEPDSHLHPDMQQRFAKFLIKLNENYNSKIIIATHSTTLLSALGQYEGNKTSVVYLNDDDELTAIVFDESLKILTTCLGGHALMGPLFNAPILLVEGDDDYKLWSQIPRHNTIKLAVIPCGGDKIFRYQKTLENLFTSILENNDAVAGYALLDNDKTIPSDEQKHIKFLQLNCLESENLYLTNEVIKKLGYDDWDKACDQVIQNHTQFGPRKQGFNEMKGWNRKQIDCKPYIEQISRCLDNHKLHWAHKLGKILGNTKPEGQLADFLGSELVNSFWKE